jgi:hypothetical protein
VPGFSIEKSTWGNKLIITADQGHQEDYLHTVNVSTVSQLQNAISSLQSNTQILVDDGHYPLSRILVIGSGVQNVALKGKSGNRDDVVIQASGMEDSAVEHAIMIRNAQDVLIADLTVRDTYYHTIMIQGEQGAAHPVLRISI